MSAANVNHNVQVADVLTKPQGAMIGFEDVAIYDGSDRDYNDFVISIKGIDGNSLGMTDIKDAMADNHNWVDTKIGSDLINYFNTGVLPSQASLV